jgi:hypothetical protein
MKNRTYQFRKDSARDQSLDAVRARLQAFAAASHATVQRRKRLLPPDFQGVFLLGTPGKGSR